MSLSHAAYRLACRVQALTLSVATTGSITMAATGSTYTRTTGSFITDGFRAGMEVTPSGFSDTTARVITRVQALTLTVASAPTPQSAAAARTLAVALPATRVWENERTTVTSPTPYVGERYFPGTIAQVTSGPLGWLEATAIYQLDLYVGQDYGTPALDAYADALAVLFAPRTSLTASTGDTVRVGILGAAPSRSSVSKADQAGFATVSVSFPLVIRTPNSV